MLVLETKRIQPFVPVGWMKYESMPEGWDKTITAAHWDDSIPSGWMRKWDKISGWMKNESMPDVLKVSFIVLH